MQLANTTCTCLCLRKCLFLNMSACKEREKTTYVHRLLKFRKTYVRDCLETIRQDVEAIKNNQAKFKDDLESLKHKLDNTIESLNVKFDTLNSEFHEVLTRVETLEGEVNKHATNINQTYERLQSLEIYSRDFNLRFYNILEESGENCPLIFEATRVTESSQTCIDYIHTNLSFPSTSGSITLEIAAHLPVFSILYNVEQILISLNLETLKDLIMGYSRQN